MGNDKQAIEGYSFIDMANQYPGPYCSMYFGDMGMEVIKIEQPGTGDPSRFLPSFFRSLNRNKKSVTLDLKKSSGRDILYRLIAKADVFTEGFRPGVAKRLGIDYDTLSKINPQLIYCSISGYGQEGPYRDLPGHDLNYMAMSGMLNSFKDREGNYTFPDVAIGDLSSAMFGIIGILTALLAREKTGRGQYVDVSMFDGLLSWMSTEFGMHFGTDDIPKGHDPGYDIFRASDGRCFTLGIAHENWFWKRLCQAVGLHEFKDLDIRDRRMRRRELVERLQAIFLTKSLKDWKEILVKADIPFAPIQSFEEVIADPHVNFREMIQKVSLSSGERIIQIGCPIKLSESFAKIRIPPPELGEQTAEILKSLGYSEGDIDNFKEEGAV